MNRRERRARDRAARAAVEETPLQIQLRVVLEQQCRAIADKLKPMLPAGVGFSLFLSDFGAKGNLAYVSTCDRKDMMRQVQSWLIKEGAGLVPVDEPTMRQVLRDADAGRIKLTAEDEKEVDRDGARAEELYRMLVGKFLVSFSRAYPDAGWEVIAPVLIRAAALHAMAGAGMPVEDFAVLAEAVAREFQAEAETVRAKAEAVMSAAAAERAKGAPS